MAPHLTFYKMLKCKINHKKATRVRRQAFLGKEEASKGHVAPIKSEGMENDVSPQPRSCQSSLASQLSIKP
jgi:hypothetical protein